MPPLDNIIERDLLAHEAAVTLATKLAITRGPAHRDLIMGHLTHLVLNIGTEETLAWLARVGDYIAYTGFEPHG